MQGETIRASALGKGEVPFRKSLQLKVFAGVLAGLAAMLAAVLFAFYVRGYELLLRSERALTANEARRLAGEMGQQLALAEGIAGSLANLGERLPREPELWSELVPGVLDLEPHPELIAGGGLWPEPGEFAPGVERASFFWGRDSFGLLQPFDDYNAPEGPGYHGEEWYVPARHQRDGRCYWSRSYLDPYTLEPMVTCTVAMRRDGRFVGASTVDLRLSGLQSFLAARGDAVGGYTFAVDRNGVFLTLPPPARGEDAGHRQGVDRSPPGLEAMVAEHPDFAALADFVRGADEHDPDAASRSLAAEIDAATPAIDRVEALRIVRQLRAPGDEEPRIDQTTLALDFFFGEPVLVTVLRMPGVDWRLTVVKPERLVREAVASALRRIAVAMILAIVLVAATAGWLVRRTLVMPIRQIAAELMASEGVGTPGRISVHGSDELALLARKFNAYAEELAESHEELAASARQFRAVTELAHDALIQIDEAGRILSLNRSGEAMFGRTESEVLGADFQSLLPWDPRSDPEVDSDSPAVDPGSRAARRMLELTARRRTGAEFPAEVSVSFWRGPRRAIYNIQVRDVTDRKRAEEQVRRLATRDTLTGLPNRTLFSDRLRKAVESRRRDGSLLGLLFLDLDQFKLANDSLGHGVGDALLKAVGDRLRGCARGGDTVARLGGDEFAVLLPHLEGPAAAAEVAERILAAVGSDFKLETHSVRVGVSIGATLCPTDDTDADQLLRKADLAMYHAKAEGRNTYRFFTERLQEELIERRTLLDQLAQAANRGELELHYQPILELATGALHGLEALIRWRHPALGLVEPDRFVPLAEQSGQIVAIGQWVIERALADIAAWEADGLPPLRLSINLSLAQFRDPNLVDRLRAALVASGVSAERIELELTESVLMHDIDSGIAILHSLRALGVGLAVDDFGTGYSSLSYLKRFPVQKLKIDKSLVLGAARESDTAAICRSVIALGHNLGLKLVGEGVERAEDLAFLVRHRCDYVQGFEFSRALPMAEARRWASARARSAAPLTAE